MSGKTKFVIILSCVLQWVITTTLFFAMFNLREVSYIDMIGNLLVAVSTVFFTYVMNNQVIDRVGDKFFQYLLVNAAIMILGELLAAHLTVLNTF